MRASTDAWAFGWLTNMPLRAEKGDKVDEIKIKPEDGQRTVWFIHWALVFVPIFLSCFVLIFIVAELAFGICTAVWVISMSPFLFWIPAYFRSLEYAIADDSVKGKKGVFWRRQVTVPYHKITNVDITQGPLQRKYHIGTIHCQTAGAGGQQGATAELKMEGLRDLDGVKEAIMQKVKSVTPSRPQEAERKVGGKSESVILSDILRELAAIRELLERQESR